MTRDMGCADCNADVDIFRTHWQGELVNDPRIYYFCSERCGRRYADRKGTRWKTLLRDGRKTD